MSPPRAPLTEAFRWPERALTVLAHQVDLRGTILQEGGQLSTHFSGIGTPELALKVLWHAAQRCGVVVGPFEPVSACDTNATCRNMLAAAMEGTDGCVFGNILDRLPGAVRDQVENLGDFEEQRRAILRVGLAPRAFCYRGKSLAHCPKATVDMSGSPCTDYSILGDQQGRDGKTVNAFLTWAKVQSQNDTPLVIHENVPGFDVGLLKETLGHKYFIFSIHVDPKDAGFMDVIYRKRRYDILVHRRRCQLAGNPEKVYGALRRALGGLRVKRNAALLASKAELAEEEDYFCQKRGIKNRQTALKGKPDWTYILLKREKKAAKDFDKRWKRQHSEHGKNNLGCWFHLGDNPIKRVVQSTKTGVWPTFRRGGGIMWSPGLRRWITPRERLAAMGFPAYRHLEQALGVTFRLALQEASSGSLRQMAGNAMHLANAGLVLLAALGTVRLVVPGGRGRSQKRPAPEGGEGAEEPTMKQPKTEYLGSMRFSLADLETLQIRTLISLCLQHGVVPAGAQGRADYVRVLSRLATDAPKEEEAAPARTCSQTRQARRRKRLGGG